jgi:hypothetical protein
VEEDDAVRGDGRVGNIARRIGSRQSCLEVETWADKGKMRECYQMAGVWNGRLVRDFSEGR